MTRWRIALLALLLAPPLAAQDPQALRAGALVRWHEDGRWMEGHLLQEVVRGQPLRVEQRLPSTARELAWDTRDLWYQVRPGRRWRGAAIGLGVGALIGAGAGFLAGDDKCSGSHWCLFQLSAGQKAVALGGTLGSIGAIIGGIAAPSAVWAPLGPTANLSRVTALIEPGRFGIRVGF